MSALALPVAAHVLTGSILTLALPGSVVVVVAVWYYRLWRSGTGER
jgi:hypothetical protein